MAIQNIKSINNKSNNRNLLRSRCCRANYSGYTTYLSESHSINVNFELVVLLWFHSKWERHHVWVFLLIAVLGFLVEVLGIATGLVFGEYEYGHALGFELLGTPPIIGLNWLLLIYCVYGMLENSKLSVVVKTIIGATLMVLFDVALEPVAMALEMWNWEGNVVPLQNYAAWFVISLAFLSIMNIAKIKTNNPLAAFLFFVQFAFFIALNILL